MIEEFFFAWEGASHPKGPWSHLRVLEIRGVEAMSTPYSFEIELVREGDAPDVDVEELVGARASLRMATRTTPAFRVIHGVIASAEELGEMDKGTRYRVELAPPLVRAAMMKKSVIFLEKTIQQIIEATLTRTTWGAGLALKTDDRADEDDGALDRYSPARAVFAWRCVDMSRITEPKARPYCVQYNESDLDFVSRLLEEEGISYHFEHTRDECILVLSDFDGGRSRLSEGGPLGPGILGREVDRVRVGGRLRPRAVSLNDYNWQNPKLDLMAQSTSGVTDFQVYEHPGRYEASKELGERLAEKREQRLDSERSFAAAEAHCRLLGAGTIFTLDHAHAKWSGDYLVTAVRHVVQNRTSFASKGAEGEPYLGQIACLRCGSSGSKGESNFRPARVTPRPRIQGSQTAIVTAEPGAEGSELNIGGPKDIGCVRVRFHWDVDAGRHEKEATSCWIRVSQIFAGASHGAMWNPRVGEEVIVDFIEGDPDRPIVTGRVYNGINLPAENPTQRPTWSALKSYTVPHDGNYNMLGFEDQKGKEQIVLHAARDLNETVLASHSTGVGGDQSNSVSGNQSVSVKGNRSVNVSGNESYTVDGTRKGWIGADDSLFVGGSRGVLVNGGDHMFKVSGSHKSEAGVSHKFKSIGFLVESTVAEFSEDTAFRVKVGGSKLTITDGMIVLDNGAGSLIAMIGGTITVKGDKVIVDGGGARAQHDGKMSLTGSVIDAKAGAIKLNG